MDTVAHACDSSIQEVDQKVKAIFSMFLTAEYNSMVYFCHVFFIHSSVAECPG